MTETASSRDGSPGSVEPGRFLTIADTAELLSISAGQAYALVRSGELPAIKIGAGGHWRVERSVLETFIQDRYEESRRLGLWKQSDYSSLQELSFDGPGRGGGHGRSAG